MKTTPHKFRVGDIVHWYDLNRGAVDTGRIEKLSNEIARVRWGNGGVSFPTIDQLWVAHGEDPR